MKRILSIFLALVALGCAALAMADTSVLRTETGLSMSLDGMDGTESHVMRLAAGDVLFLSIVVREGTVRTVIRPEGGEALYDSTDIPDVGYRVEIPEGGLYRISVTGEGATGNVWIQLMEELYAAGRLEMPEARERIQSDLGYLIEYNPEMFAYAASIEENVDQFALREEGENPSTYLRVEKLDGDYQEHADSYVRRASAEGQPVKEEPPELIDWRATRIFERTHVDAGGSTEQRTVFVEAGEHQTFRIDMFYAAGEDGGIWNRMQNMILSMNFMF